MESRQLASFVRGIDFGSIGVYDLTVPQPGGNRSREEHLAQGFIWRPGAVDFMMLDQFGTTRLRVLLGQRVALGAETVRAILVPFAVPATGAVDVSTGYEWTTVAVPTGHYALLFETGYAPSLETDADRAASMPGMWCDLTFVPADGPVAAAVLRADPALSPPDPLLLEADPA